MDHKQWEQDIKQLARRLSFAAKCINFYLQVGKLHTCNDCGVVKCKYAPELGDDVRYNCPHWEPGKE